MRRWRTKSYYPKARATCVPWVTKRISSKFLSSVTKKSCTKLSHKAPYALESLTHITDLCITQQRETFWHPMDSKSNPSTCRGESVRTTPEQFFSVSVHSESIRRELREHDSLTISHSIFYPSPFTWHLIIRRQCISCNYNTHCYTFHLSDPSLIVKTSIHPVPQNMQLSKDTAQIQDQLGGAITVSQ